MEIVASWAVFDAGLIGLEEAFREMPRGVVEYLQGEMCYAAAVVVAKQAKKSTAFQDVTGALRRSIRGRRKSSRIEGERVPNSAAEARIGGTKGARQGHLIEGGTVERFHASGKSVGKVKETPVLVPAYRQSAESAFHAGVNAGVAEFEAFINAVRVGGVNSRQGRAIDRDR